MDDTQIKNSIQELLEKLGVVFDSILVEDVAGQKMFTIQTADSKQLIGPHGDHLRSFTYILRKMLEKKTQNKEDLRFMVDVNGYQLKSIKDVEQKATLLAERVRTFKSSAELAPMSPYERMIIHSLFSNDPHIATESEGMGPTRHIVLRYVENK